MKWMSKKASIILAIVNMVILIVGTAYFMHTGDEIILKADGEGIEIYGGYTKAEGDGFFIDETLGYSGKCFMTGESVIMPAGLYRVTYQYVTDSPENYVEVVPGDGSYRAFKADNIIFPIADRIFSDKIWVSAQQDVRFNFYYAGTGYFEVNGITITPITNTAGIIYMIGLLLLINCFVLLYFRNKKQPYQVSTKQTVFVVAMTVLYASLPLLQPDLGYGHDLMFHLNRIEGIKQGLQGGQFPVYIQPQWLHNYGYSVSVFYPDFFLYFPALLVLGRVPIDTAYKAYVIGINIATAMAAYYSFRKITKDRYAGYLGCILYTLSAYRLVNLYKRAAVGEYTAMTVLPLLILVLWQIYTYDHKSKEYQKLWVLPVFCCSVIVQSHVLSCEMVGIFVVLLGLVMWRKTFRKETLCVIAKIVLATGILNIGFLVPALDYSKLDLNAVYDWGVTVGIQNRGCTFLHMFSLILSDENFWGPGLALLVVLITFIYLVINTSRQEKQDRAAFYRLATVTCGFGLLAIFMSMEIFPYDRTRIWEDFYVLLTKIQFPFRYLTIVTLVLSLLGCLTYVMLGWKKSAHAQKLFVAVLAVLMMITSSDLYATRDINGVYKTYDIGGIDTEYIGAHEYMYVTVDVDSYKDQLKPQTYLADDGVAVNNYLRDKGNISISCNNTNGETAIVKLPMINWPNYVATDVTTGEKIAITMDKEDAQMKLSLPAGYQGDIQVHYVVPLKWRIVEVISLIAFILLAGYAVKLLIENKKKVEKSTSSELQ